MKYAIEAYFDRDTEAALAHLAGRVAEEGISTKFLEWKSRPHITLACYNDIDEADCIPKLKAFHRHGHNLCFPCGKRCAFRASKRTPCGALRL